MTAPLPPEAGFFIPDDPELVCAMIDVLEEALRRIRVAQEMPGAHSCAIDAHVIGLIQELELAATSDPDCKGDANAVEATADGSTDAIADNGATGAQPAPGACGESAGRST